MDIAEKLIELVGENRILYDPSYMEFRNKESKEQKWEEIGKKLDISAIAAKNRWRTIKDRYFRIKKEGLNPGGPCRSKKGRKSYKFANKLSFLDEITNCRSMRRESYRIKDEDTCDDEKSIVICKEIANKFLDNDNTTTFFESEQIEYDDKPQTPAVSVDLNDKTQMSLNSLESRISSTNNKHDTLHITNRTKKRTKEYTFCESLALQLEESNLPSKLFREFQIKAIQLLDELVHIAESDNLQSSNYNEII